MISAEKELLVVVDMLKGFIEEGPLSSERIRKLVIPIKELLEHHPGEVVFVSDAHSENSVEFQDYPPHCIIGTKEAEIIDELSPYAVVSFTKNSVNAFHADPFRRYLIGKLREYEQISVIGCCTDICVLNLALAVKSYISEKNLPNEVNVLRDYVETFHTSGHDGEEASACAFKILKANGVRIR